MRYMDSSSLFTSSTKSSISIVSHDFKKFTDFYRQEIVILLVINLKRIVSKRVCHRDLTKIQEYMKSKILVNIDKKNLIAKISKIRDQFKNLAI